MSKILFFIAILLSNPAQCQMLVGERLLSADEALRELGIGLPSNLQCTTEEDMPVNLPVKCGVAFSLHVSIDRIEDGITDWDQMLASIPVSGIWQEVGDLILPPLQWPETPRTYWRFNRNHQEFLCVRSVLTAPGMAGQPHQEGACMVWFAGSRSILWVKFADTSITERWNPNVVQPEDATWLEFTISAIVSQTIGY